MRLRRVVLLLLLLLLPSSAKAAAQAVTSTELIEDALAFNEKAVTYRGEVIGDILYRGDSAWVNVSDGVNAIGCYIPASEAEKIDSIGRYRIVGDTVELTGIFHRDCPEHGGDLDIHADTIIVLKKGHEVEDKPSAGLMIAAGALVPCVIAGAMLEIRKRHVL